MNRFNALQLSSHHVVSLRTWLAHVRLSTLRCASSCLPSAILIIAGRFFSSKSGAAMVEFALALPILILLSLGGFEVTRHILIQQKISKTVSSMSDLVARSKSISTTELDQMFQAVPHLMEPYNKSSDLVVIISSVANYGSGPVVTWQQKGGGTKTTASNIGMTGGSASLPAGFTLANNENTIVAEIFYDYKPAVASNIVGASTIYKVKFNMPRLGSLDVLK